MSVSSGRRLEKEDFQIIDEYCLRCALCDKFKFSQYESAESFVLHLRKVHCATLALSQNLDHEHRTLFCARVKHEIGFEAELPPPTFSGSECVRCHVCGKRVGLETPYSPTNFIRHLRESKGCAAIEMKARKSMGHRSAKSAPKSPEKPRPVLKESPVKSEKPKIEKPGPKKDAEPEKPKVAVVKDKQESKNGLIDAKFFGPPAKQQDTVMTKVKRATVMYRMLKHEWKQIPLYRKRNLSYVRRFREDRPKRSTPPPILIEPAAKRAKFSSSPSSSRESSPEPECKIVFESLRDNLLGTGAQCKIDAFLRKIGRSKPQTETLGSCEIGLNNDANSYTLPVPDTGTNGHKSSETWLILRVTLPRNMDASTSGGRALRNVAQRQAQKASVSGLRSEQKSPSKSQDTVLFSQKLVSKGTELALKQGSYTMKLIAADKVGSMQSKDFIEKMNKEIKSFQEGPFIKHSIYRTLKPVSDDSDDSDEDSAPPKLQPIKPSTPVKPNLPSRLVYRFCADPCPASVKLGSSTGYTTEVSRPGTCPWCDRKFNDLCLILTHLRLEHNRFEFLYTPGAGRDLPVVNVFPTTLADFRLESAPSRVLADKPVKRPLKNDVHSEVVLVKAQAVRAREHWDRKRLKDFSRPEKPLRVSRVRGHVRQYFHSQTCRPIGTSEESSDSEGELDPPWLREYGRRCLDEFTDLNDGEKAVMNRWNAFLLKQPCLAYGQVFSQCERWLKREGALLVDCGLSYNCSLHFVGLAKLGKLDNDQLTYLMRLLQQF